jgi:flagellar hook-associated protein 1 FlgK
MGLSVSLNNALSGLKIGQSAMEVLSQNVANAGTPGYHARSVSVIDTKGANSSYAREGTLTRAFNESLQQHFTTANSDFAYADVRADFLNTLQNLFGMPGSTGSLDSAFNDFQSAMTSLAATPDNFATRAEAVQNAQLLAQALNRTTGDIQNLRQYV